MLAFASAERFLRESGDSGGSRAASEKRQQAAAVHEARLFAQPSKFATASISLLGLVFREAGPVVPSTFEVVATKVA
jgi:hypothetical protein